MFRSPLLSVLLLSLALSPFGVASLAQGEEPAQPPLNVLLITADDLNYDSLGVTGCQVDNITPNIDRLASEGILFRRAHVNIAVCQPCRQVLMTGLYPIHNGGIGFNPIDDDIPTLQESLEVAGYHLGIMAKVGHLSPQKKFCWDMAIHHRELAAGRDAAAYRAHTLEFIAQAKAENRPFFLMANAQDPHRPFAGSPGDRQRAELVNRTIGEEEVEIPGFLPDLPDVRQEIAEYYTSVHRCDEVVGAVLEALEESGEAENTIVMFLSDHGMALPFSKTNCWLTSTHTPWIVRWPGVAMPNTEDTEHFISSIDFMPTIMEALNIEPVEPLDGVSFLPLISGGTQEGREQVFTSFHETSGRRGYPMRSIHEGDMSYIYNPWSDGELVFRNESQAGRTMRAMKEAAAEDAEIAERVDLFLYRVPEELFDYNADPDALHNLIDDPAYAAQLAHLRQQLLEHLQEIEDPLAEQFEAFLAEDAQ